SKIGRTLRVIVDSENETHYVGRSEFDSPEVDPEVLISKEVPLKIGEFYDVRITDALPFELFASPVI
ncbi:MAG: TRAM domain-containing protein, partial [Muribaculaceae bacterium]|nr:TRAM domain-containing protein [Muribaculaceae bacterium]